MTADIGNYLLAILSSSTVTSLILLWFFIRNPEKVEKWVSLFLKTFAFVSARAARTHMATDIQSKIAEARKELNIREEVLPYGVKIKWTDVDDVETDLKDKRLVVMMRPYASQAKNFATIISVYIPEVLLPKAKRYVEPKLMTGIEHTISKSILQRNSKALDYYLNAFLEKDNDIASYITKMDKVHMQGALSRLLLPELKRLNVLYPQESNSMVFKETKNFSEMVYNFVTKEPGVDVSPNYLGNHIKMAIVAIAKPYQLVEGKVPASYTFIQKAKEKGIDHFYIVCTEAFIQYAKDLIEDCKNKLSLSKVFEEEYKATFREKQTIMFCAVLVSS